MSQLALAQSIARHAHRDQVEKVSGEPYVNHLARVAELVDGRDAKCVAWLHDVLEDTDVTTEMLVDAGVAHKVIDAVLVLTRDPKTTYYRYIKQIVDSGNRLAFTVKRADLIDHLRPNCPAQLRVRYERSLQLLEA